jgi:AraC family transcriptional regulator
MKKRGGGDDEMVRVMAAVGGEIAWFQAATEDVDEAVAQVLALDRNDLRCLDRLRYAPQPLESLAGSLGLGGRALRDLVARLETAGYARRMGSAGDGVGVVVDLTPHARTWFESLYGPVRDEGFQILSSYRVADLQLVLRFLTDARALQERHALRLRGLEASGSGRTLKNRPRGGLSPAALRRVQLYVEAHLDGPLTIEALAARAGVSPYHFARGFKASTGTTPHGHVQKQRIERAAQLIRETDQPLAQIALATGFSTQSKLTSAFRKLMGVTPARYRRDGPE